MNNEKVLFIGAHPDDIDLGCASTMLYHHLKNDDITTIILTEGEKGGNPNSRLIEQTNSFKILAPNSKNIFLNFPDTQTIFYKYEIIDKIKELVSDNAPHVAYIPTPNDLHQDHLVAYECAMVAFNSINISKILCYETPSSTQKFAPTFFKFFNLDKFKLKLEALKCHKSQIKKPYFSEEAIYSIAKMRATQGRYHNRFAEAFEIIRLIEF